jgi:hypothetical protein
MDHGAGNVPSLMAALIHRQVQRWFVNAGPYFMASKYRETVEITTGLYGALRAAVEMGARVNTAARSLDKPRFERRHELPLGRTPAPELPGRSDMANVAEACVEIQHGSIVPT